MWTDSIEVLNPYEETAKLIAKKKEEVFEARNRLCACCKKRKCKRCILANPLKQFDIGF